MGRVIDRVPMACDARTHVVILHGRFVRSRCTDPRCPAVRHARANGLRAYHVWDLQRELPNGHYKGWNEYEPAPSRLADQE